MIPPQEPDSISLPRGFGDVVLSVDESHRKAVCHACEEVIESHERRLRIAARMRYAYRGHSLPKLSSKPWYVHLKCILNLVEGEPIVDYDRCYVCSLDLDADDAFMRLVLPQPFRIKKICFDCSMSGLFRQCTHCSMMYNARMVSKSVVDDLWYCDQCSDVKKEYSDVEVITVKDMKKKQREDRRWLDEQERIARKAFAGEGLFDG